MSVYLIANIEVRPAAWDRFTAAVGEMIPILEGVGWRLAGAYVTRVGRLNTVTDIWELDDYNHMNIGWGAVAQSPRYAAIQTALQEAVISETLTFADRLDFPRPAA